VRFVQVAIDDLPFPVVTLLNVIGVPWPYVNEDSVSEFASLVRRFGLAVEATHRDATASVQSVAAAYRSTASDRMVDGWQRLSDRHVTELVDGCAVLAGALDVAAAYIVAQKAAALGELVGMAAAFAADQAAAVATLGLAESAAPLIIVGARKLMESLVMDLEQHLITVVTQAALTPLLTTVEAALAGLDWSQSGAEGPLGDGAVQLDAVEARTHTMALAWHASDMRGHAQTFAAGIQALKF
jgi:hypothetical protein